MAANPLNKLLRPRLPSAAAGIETDAAAVVQLDRSRSGFVVRRAASVRLAEGLIEPSFENQNISDPTELARALAELATGAGLLKQRKWSVCLPEASTRAAILTIEGPTTSRRELEEVFQWKVERSFGAPVSALRLAREQLPQDAKRQTRFLVNALHRDVLAGYEAVLDALGWHVGLILPRHAGESQWLRNGHQGDSLLLTAHDEGFTAVLLRGGSLLALRSVFCEAAECDDELHRFLLFYRDRASSGVESPQIDRLLVIGDQLDKRRVAEIANEALGVRLKPMSAADVGLVVPAGEVDFDAIAAPAGLARMAW